MVHPLFANRETLPLIRKQELMNACEIMGVTDLRMLGMRYKTMEFEDEKWLTGILRDTLMEVRPSLLITFYPGLGVHPDHNAMA
jgi:N-acetylglucosamine malate deacetylase 2